MTTVLALSGGGGKCAFQAGAVSVLESEIGLRWDAVSGVSGGALNASLIACHKTPSLVPLWQQLRESDLHKDGFFRALWRLATFKEGLFDNSPLRKTLRENLFTDAQIPLRYSAVDISAQNPSRFLFTEDDLSAETLLASASIPGLWPPVKMTIDGQERSLVDAGTHDSVLIEPLMEFVPDRVVLVDVGPSSYHDIVGHPTLDGLLRAYGAARAEMRSEDVAVITRITDVVRQARRHNDETGCHFQYCNENGDSYREIEVVHISPDRPLGSPLDFDRRTLDARIIAGMRAARTTADQLREDA